MTVRSRDQQLLDHAHRGRHRRLNTEGGREGQHVGSVCHVLGCSRQGVVRLGGCGVSVDQDLCGLSKTATEGLGERVERLDVLGVVWEEVREGELGRDVGETEIPETAEPEHHDEGGNRRAFGEHRRPLHDLGEETFARRSHRLAGKSSVALGTPIQDVAHGRHEGEHEDERHHDADGCEDSEVLQRRDRVDHVGEKPDGGGHGGEGQGDADGADRLADAT